MKIRKPLKILSRTSSITNSFVQAIIPSIEPSEQERREALAILEIDENDMRCAYCGTPSTDWDHLRPLVRGKRPTGYINEVRNLVPACGPCNQSKSGADWKTWMIGNARNSPRSRKVADLEKRIARLERFEAWGGVEPLPLAELGGEHWDAHWKNLEAIVSLMRDAQLHAALLQGAIRIALAKKRSSTEAVSFETISVDERDR